MQHLLHSSISFTELDWFLEPIDQPQLATDSYLHSISAKPQRLPRPFKPGPGKHWQVRSIERTDPNWIAVCISSPTPGRYPLLPPDLPLMIMHRFRSLGQNRHWMLDPFHDTDYSFYLSPSPFFPPHSPWKIAKHTNRGNLHAIVSRPRLSASALADGQLVEPVTLFVAGHWIPSSGSGSVATEGIRI